ncbi:MAG TPA: formate dehydrogenase accessory protein FdhE [Thermoanaerobaculia bacterium]
MTAGDEFGRRAARAAELARDPGAAADLLRFAAALLSAQGRAASAFAALHALEPLTGDLRTDIDRLIPRLSPFLELVAEKAPPELAEEAHRRSIEATIAAETARGRLLAWWDAPGSGEDYLSRAFLRPYLAVATGLSLPVPRRRTPGRCPSCGGPPLLSIRRADPESEAGRRFLVCADCGGEWPFGRVRCPSCCEESPEKLPVFQTDRHSGVRVEACEACHRYLKSIDLTVDARPVPEVDDLLSIAVDLWAQEEGFTRIAPGVAGL